MEQIPGPLFSSLFMTIAEYEDNYKKSLFYVERDYMQEYRKHITGMCHVASIAKIYILKNWQKVTDWGDLEVKITHGPTGKVTHYYNHEREMQRATDRIERSKKCEANTGIKRSRVLDKLFESLEERKAHLHNPIINVNKVILDSTDGDFSIVINEKDDHWWISDEEIIIIADYIEQQLKTKNS